MACSRGFWPAPRRFTAQQVADNNADVETVVVTGTQFNTDVAPAKASIDTMEPQTIINKSYIQGLGCRHGGLYHHSRHRPQHERSGH